MRRNYSAAAAAASKPLRLQSDVAVSLPLLLLLLEVCSTAAGVHIIVPLLRSDSAPSPRSTPAARSQLALMYNCPRAATIRCMEKGRLWALSRGVYERVAKT